MNRFGTVQQQSWDWRAACNFMFGGAGSALMFIVPFAYFPEVPPRMPVLLALSLIGLGLLSVWLEIGRPWRFLHVFFHPQTSWMTREGSVGVMLFALSLTGIAFGIPFVIWIAGILGLTFLFCQAQMLKASKGIPAWREPSIVYLVCVTGLSEGMALLLLSVQLLNENPVALRLTCLVFLAARTISWLVYRKNVGKAGASSKTLTALKRIHPVQVIAGNFVPAMLIIGTLALPGIAGPATVGASLLMILAGWFTKFIIITRAAQVQGYGLAKVQKGRPSIRPPVRRKPDRFVF